MIPINTFVLVHGTFARNAEWVKEESTLCCALQTAFPDSKIVDFQWTGDNVQSVREREALRLRKLLLALGSDSCYPRRLAVVAHSHGGNLAIEAVRREAPIPNLQCIVCLATPFLQFDASPPNAPLNLLEHIFNFWPLYFMALYRGHNPILDLACVDTSRIGYVLTFTCMLFVCMLIVGVNGLIRRGLSRFVRKGLARQAPPSLDWAVPMLAVAHPYDEAYAYLTFLNLLTRSPRLIRWAVLVCCIFLAVGWFQLAAAGGFYCTYLESWGRLSWARAGLAGLASGSVIAQLWVVATVLSLGFEAVWAVVVTTCLHFFRGSKALASMLTSVGLPQMMQVGFGESFRQTWVGSVDVRRLPQGASGAKLSKIKYKRRGAILHSAIYSAPEVIDAILVFIHSTCLPMNSVAQEKASSGEDNSKKQAWLAEIGKRAAFLMALAGIFYPLSRARREAIPGELGLGEVVHSATSPLRAPQADFDEDMRTFQRLDDAAHSAEIATRLRIEPQAFQDYLLTEKQAGRLDLRAQLAWELLIKSIHVPMRSDVHEEDFESADIAGDTIAAFLKLRRARVSDDLRISPEDLAWTQTRWTLQERRRFSEVLNRASELFSDGKALSPEAAYEQALRDFAKRGYSPSAIPKDWNIGMAH